MTNPKYDRELAARHAATNSCPSRKYAYANRSAAKRAASRIRSRTGEHLRPYECNDCGLWHLGHLPTRVLLGEVGVDEHYRQKGND